MAIRHPSDYLSDLNISQDCIYDMIIPTKEVPQSISINGRPNKYKTYTKPVYVVDTMVNMSNINLTPEQAYAVIVNTQRVVPESKPVSQKTNKPESLMTINDISDIPRPPEIFTGRDNFHETKNREILMSMYGLDEFSFPKLRAVIKEDIQTQNRFVKFTNADMTNYITKITSTSIPDRATISTALSETFEEHQQRQRDNRPYTRSEAREYFEKLRSTPTPKPPRGLPSPSEPVSLDLP